MDTQNLLTRPKNLSSWAELEQPLLDAAQQVIAWKVVLGAMLQSESNFTEDFLDSLNLDLDEAKNLVFLAEVRPEWQKSSAVDLSDNIAISALHSRWECPIRALICRFLWEKNSKAIEAAK